MFGISACVCAHSTYIPLGVIQNRICVYHHHLAVSNVSAEHRMQISDKLIIELNRRCRSLTLSRYALLLQDDASNPSTKVYRTPESSHPHIL